jgi:hypothetical protein
MSIASPSTSHPSPAFSLLFLPLRLLRNDDRRQPPRDNSATLAFSPSHSLVTVPTIFLYNFPYVRHNFDARLGLLVGTTESLHINQPSCSSRRVSRLILSLSIISLFVFCLIRSRSRTHRPTSTHSASLRLRPQFGRNRCPHAFSRYPLFSSPYSLDDDSIAASALVTVHHAELRMPLSL